MDENFRLMNLEQRGMYWTLLNHSWLNEGLPQSLEDIRDLCHIAEADFQRIWARVSRCFEIVEGRYRNRRQEQERLEARTKSEKATESVRTRYERTTDVPIRASESVSDSFSESKSFKKNQERWFSEELWPVCWRKIDRAEALKSFLKKAVSEEAKDRIVAAAARASEVYLKREPDKRPHMSTWLNKERFDDEVAEDTRNGSEEYDIRKAMRQ